jgi:ADP-heptose:LPS heptosyltransferase
MQALQRADKLLGWLACLALQPWRWTRRLRLRLAARERAPRVLLIKFWGIGSLQLLTPAVSQVRQRHAGSEFVLLTLAGNAEFARGLGTFDRVLTLDVDGPSWPRMFGRICRLIMSLRRERFETVYDFEFFTRFSAVVSTLTGAPVTRGFEAPSVWRGGLHSQAVPFNRYWHVARNFRVLAGDSGLEDVMPADFAPLAFSAQDAARVDALLSEHGIGAGVDFAVLNPNAGKLSLERRWPKEHFAALAGSLERTQQLPAVLIGSSAEQAYTQQALLLARQQGAQAVLNLAGRLSTAELAALFSRASVLVTNDSGPMHIAAALGTPTLGLFGPETPVMYRPVGWNVRSLYRPPPCSPCINVHDNKLASCVWGRPECLMNLEVEEVLRETQALLKGSSVELRPVRRAARAAGAEGSRKADERPHRGQGPSD